MKSNRMSGPKGGGYEQETNPWIQVYLIAERSRGKNQTGGNRENGEQEN
jgi:hypothetical protein